jgi:two-component system, cell cycle response regulator
VCHGQNLLDRAAQAPGRQASLAVPRQDGQIGVELPRDRCDSLRRVALLEPQANGPCPGLLPLAQELLQAGVGLLAGDLPIDQVGRVRAATFVRSLHDVKQRDRASEARGDRDGVHEAALGEGRTIDAHEDAPDGMSILRELLRAGRHVLAVRPGKFGVVAHLRGDGIQEAGQRRDLAAWRAQRDCRHLALALRLAELQIAMEPAWAPVARGLVDELSPPHLPLARGLLSSSAVMSSVPRLESHVDGVREEIPVARDPDATIATAPVRRISANLNLEHTPVAPLVLPPPRRDTPLRPVALTPPREARATLTLLTGTRAGLLHAIDGASTTIGRSAESDLVVDEEGVSRHHARVDRTVEGAFYVEDLGSTNGTFLGADRIGIALLRGGDLLQLGPSLQVRFAIVDSPEESFYRRLYESSMHDPLTHVFNRAYMGERLLAEISTSRRTGSDMTLLMLDIDHLKEVNDRFGHMAGDRALCTVAARILRALRATDMLARYGGDEFVVIASATGRDEAQLLAERVLRAVEGLHMGARGGTVRITASIGVAAVDEVAACDDPAGALIALADERMYSAKSGGRNRVCRNSRPPAG